MVGIQHEGLIGILHNTTLRKQVRNKPVANNTIHYTKVHLRTIYFIKLYKSTHIKILHHTVTSIALVYIK